MWVMQVTQGTVDEGINALAQKKLRLDAAVLEGITSTGGGKASETQAMGELLQSLIAGACRAVQTWALNPTLGKGEL